MTVIQRGRCSACHQPARRGPSGNWWHVNGECTATPEQPAEFIPDQSDTP